MEKFSHWFWTAVEAYGRTFMIELEDGTAFFIGHPYLI